jgi:hypothetical protein
MADVREQQWPSLVDLDQRQPSPTITVKQPPVQAAATPNKQGLRVQHLGSRFAHK